MTRTEHQTLVKGAETGSVLYSAFTGLRMGAPLLARGVKWLMGNQILTAQRGD